MSAYLRKGRGWKYDFTLGGRRHTSRYYKTKGEAKQAEAWRREELTNPLPEGSSQEETPTDIAFLELVNRRLDHVKAYNSERHYREYFYLARRWVKRWQELTCAQITREEIEKFVFERSRKSRHTANKEVRYLRAAFNFGKKRGLVSHNPTDGIEFMPEEHRVRYVPPPEDIERVLAAADADTREYLLAIRDTMARVSEINRLCWDDVDLQHGTVTLYTRKKRGGHLTPRKVPMTERLQEQLERRHERRNHRLPWVLFWHRYWSRLEGRWVSARIRAARRS